jgi:hypothetical protein
MLNLAMHINSLILRASSTDPFSVNARMALPFPQVEAAAHNDACEKTALLQGDVRLRPPAVNGVRSRSGSVRSLKSAGVEEGTEVDVDIGVSVYRWWALFVFCVVSAVQNIAWISFSTIVDEATDYYSCSDNQIQFLIAVSSAIFVPAVFFVNPLNDKFGLRAVVIFSSITVALAAVRAFISEPLPA